jgi:heat shock protein HtpX
LLDVMDEKAIEWVVAHEMAHVLNGDMVTMALLQWILNTFVIFISRSIANIISNFLDEELSWIAHLVVVIVLEILFWLLASIILMAFSRHREFRADHWAAVFVWKEKMIAWLQALKNMQKMSHEDKTSFAAMKISSHKRWGLMSLFASHPSLDDRIRALENANI